MVLVVRALRHARILIAVQPFLQRLQGLAHVLHFTVTHEGIQDVSLRRVANQIKDDSIIVEPPVPHGFEPDFKKPIH